MEEKLDDFKLEQLAAGVFVTVASDSEKTLQELFAERQTSLFADLSMLLVEFLLVGAGKLLVDDWLLCLGLRVSHLEVLDLFRDAEIFVVKLHKADVVCSDVEQKQLLIENIFGEPFRERENESHKGEH